MARTSHLPNRAGVGFKPQHFAEIVRAPQLLGFFEVHAENYMGDGGPAHAMLRALRADYALSVHGVGLSIGSPEPLNEDHLHRLKTLCERYQPESFSEHLAWSSHGGNFYNDLLPLPYTKATLMAIADHIDQVQSVLQRQMLLENPATYVRFDECTYPEVEFLREIAYRTGCGLLLDINNVYVSAINHGTSAGEYLAAFPVECVREVHLAGHDAQSDESQGTLLIDAHGSTVEDVVWRLYASVVDRTGPLPTLIEWDNNVPEWTTLRGEAEAAAAIMARSRAAAA
jgi:uncharacterized protein (UPF0276 family)